MNRQKHVASLTQEIFDLVIIGGGICGAGVARDAASRGMKVALVEAQDFASGTSSRSSKLIHGGIRYLENLEFGLVYEALSERQLLFDIAPHLVHPLRFMLPIYKGARVAKMGLGMWAYDLLSFFEAPELHESCDAQSTLSRMPILNSDGLQGSYLYSDGYMDDDRLVIETLRSAVRYGAKIANYVKATSAEFADGRLVAVGCVDEMSDEQSKNKLTIRGRHFVSTVGPWTDRLASEILPSWKKIMRPTKGVHLTFSRERLPIKDAVVMVSDDQKRIVFAIPRHEMVIVGTTDTDFQGDPSEVRTEASDVEYLLHVTEHYFPNAKIKKSDIIASYSGVRPLVHDGSESESQTSREHLIIGDSRNITFVTGGKYTTYRKIAEDAMNKALENFSLEDQLRWRLNKTHEPLNSLATADQIFFARAQAEKWAGEFAVDVGTVHFLVERHGAEAYKILEKHSHLINPSSTNARWYFEAHHAIDETMCQSVVDFYLRRAPLFLSRHDHGFLFLNEILNLFQKRLNLTDEQRSQQNNALRQHLEDEMSWRKKIL